MVLIETKNRKPVEALNIDLGYFHVKRDGKLNQKELRQGLADAMKAVSFSDEEPPTNVVDASATFAVKRYRDKHTWAPSPDELNQIYRLVFNSPKT